MIKSIVICTIAGTLIGVVVTNYVDTLRINEKISSSAAFDAKEAAQRLQDERDKTAVAIERERAANARVDQLAEQNHAHERELADDYDSALQRLRNRVPAACVAAAASSLRAHASAAPTAKADGPPPVRLYQADGERALLIAKRAAETSRQLADLQDYLRAVAPACGISIPPESVAVHTEGK